MSVNTIQTAAVIQSELDKAAVEQATSGWMEVNSNLVKYNGGSEVKIPELSMDGLADYDRQNGFVAGGVNFKYQTKTMTQDRGRSFSFDENAVDETNFVLTAATVMGEFQRTKVIPEIDAYRYSTIAAACIKAKTASGGYVLAKKPSVISVGDILRALEGSLEPVKCAAFDTTTGEGCMASDGCVTKYVWQKINDSINDTVNQIMLDELIQESKSINPDGECENPKCSQ